jgi:hypothetical protein
MGEVIRLERGNARCGLCGGNGRIAFGERPAAMVACPRCCGAVRLVERPARPFHAEARMVPLLAWGALNIAGTVAIGVVQFMLLATVRFIAG